MTARTITDPNYLKRYKRTSRRNATWGIGLLAGAVLICGLVYLYSEKNTAVASINTPPAIVPPAGSTLPPAPSINPTNKEIH
jgi:hypothetical protein